VKLIRYDAPDDRSVTVSGDSVTKTGPVSAVNLEVLKTREACRVARECGLFLAPEVVMHDSVAGVVGFRRVCSVEPVGYLDRNAGAVADLPERLGAALAAIHRGMRLPEEERRPLPADYGCSGAPEVVIHGDFTGRNVLIRASDGALLIVDWMTSYRLGEMCTVGPAWFDLAWFVRWQFLRLGLRGVPSAAGEACTRLVRAYLIGHPFAGVREFGAYLQLIARADRRRRDVCFSLRRRMAALRGDVALLSYAGALARGRHG